MKILFSSLLILLLSSCTKTNDLSVDLASQKVRIENDIRQLEQMIKENPDGIVQYSEKKLEEYSDSNSSKLDGSRIMRGLYGVTANAFRDAKIEDHEIDVIKLNLKMAKDSLRAIEEKLNPTPATPKPSLSSHDKKKIQNILK